LSDFGKGKPIEIANGNFEEADLSKDSLTKVRFSTLTNFKDANLTSVNFSKSNQSDRISDCSFENADLTGPRFVGKALADVTMEGAVLDGTDFRQADLRNAHDLTLEQLKTAKVDRQTQLPNNVIAEIKATRDKMPEWTAEFA
jgi:uncharacterized protein YjbI with pentapeptide repeats